MNCPIDATPLTVTERSGVEIDYCPTCRGVWLDRGELDKITERASEYGPRPAPPEADRWAGRQRGERKRSRLSELFEFGD